MRTRRLLALIYKEILELSRDTVLVIFLVYSFTGDILVAAKGVRLDLHNAGISALSQDHGPITREFIADFAPPYFRIHSETNEDSIMRRLDAGQDVAGIVIPPKFEARLMRNAPASVQLFLDGSSATQASLAEGYAREIGARVAERTAIERLGMLPDAREALPIAGSELRVDFNPNRNEEWFQGLQEMLMMISLLAIALPAAALIREREHGTIEQLLISPVAPWEILLAKTLASSLTLVMCTAVAVFGLIIPVLHVPIRGNLLLFFASTTLFVFTMSGLGLLVASLCRTMPQVAMISILVAAPILFLSGAWTPPEAMPKWFAEMTVLSPLRWFNDVAFGVFLRGATLGDLLIPVTMMTALGGIFFLWGMLRLRSHLD